MKVGQIDRIIFHTKINVMQPFRSFIFDRNYLRLELNFHVAHTYVCSCIYIILHITRCSFYRLLDKLRSYNVMMVVYIWRNFAANCINHVPFNSFIHAYNTAHFETFGDQYQINRFFDVRKSNHSENPLYDFALCLKILRCDI